jgi:hypothetical protein
MPETQPNNEEAGTQAGANNENAGGTDAGAGTQPAGENGTAGGDGAKRRSLEDLLGSLDDESRKTVLDQVSKARGEAKGLRDRLKQAEPQLAEYNKLLESQKTAEQKANDAAEAAEKRATAAIGRAVKSEIRAIAADSFADPDDAATALDPTEYVDENGEIDIEGIKRELAALLERKPHWGKGEGTTARRPAPDRSQGSSANARSAKSEGEQFAAFLSNQLGRKG